MALTFRALALAGALAGTTMIAAPASAASLPSSPSLGATSAAFDFSRYNAATDTAEWHCRWRCGWGGGWGRHRGWRRNRVDAGDVILGAVVIGGIAAILNSETRRERDRQRDVVIYDRDLDRRDADWVRRGDQRPRARPAAAAASGLDNAVTMCLNAIEREAAVDTVDNVERDASGWEVSGVLVTGSSFTCRIGNDGRIGGIDFGGFAARSSGSADGQWNDDAYASARNAVGGTVRPDIAVQETTVQIARGQAPRASAPRMPAYPGGPIPGEDIPETAPEPVGDR